MPASDQLEYQVTTLTKLVAGVRPDQMDDPTPCEEWDVRGLLNHFVGGAGMFTAAFNGEGSAIDPDAPVPDLVGDDPLAAWHAAIANFNAAVDEPGALDRVISLPFGEMPGAVVLEILKFDLTVHCWDLARATEDQGTTLVPLRVYFKDGRIKIELAVAKGKARYDKRQALATKDAKRETERALKDMRRG